ncbi:hypothetical protein AVEN_204753-1 [Araneus ventricosus]|uniref:Uncharacterized protein n=1 Tax=Araneus ventricosus TaxID=182803 RepID=A0A4Y2FWV8_ARAVE|nr:hypothetical protein AVEN_204753-1 [Araneus ventricosus]
MLRWHLTGFTMCAGVPSCIKIVYPHMHAGEVLGNDMVAHKRFIAYTIESTGSRTRRTMSSKKNGLTINHAVNPHYKATFPEHVDVRAEFPLPIFCYFEY